MCKIHPKTPISVECMALIPSKLCRWFVYCSKTWSPPDASRAQEHAIECVDARFPISELGAARAKIPDWLLDVSAMQLLVPGMVHPGRTMSLNRNGQVTIVFHGIAHFIPILDMNSGPPDVTACCTRLLRSGSSGWWSHADDSPWLHCSWTSKPDNPTSKNGDSTSLQCLDRRGRTKMKSMGCG
jgi:hypothetical protein